MIWLVAISVVVAVLVAASVIADGDDVLVAGMKGIAAGLFWLPVVIVSAPLGALGGAGWLISRLIKKGER